MKEYNVKKEYYNSYSKFFYLLFKFILIKICSLFYILFFKQYPPTLKYVTTLI